MQVWTQVTKLDEQVAVKPVEETEAGGSSATPVLLSTWTNCKRDISPGEHPSGSDEQFSPTRKIILN